DDEIEADPKGRNDQAENRQYLRQIRRPKEQVEEQQQADTERNSTDLFDIVGNPSNKLRRILKRRSARGRRRWRGIKPDSRKAESAQNGRRARVLEHEKQPEKSEFAVHSSKQRIETKLQQYPAQGLDQQ